MELFENIRLKIGKVFLGKKIARTKRKVSYSNIGLVKNIGIVWDASKTSDFTALSKFYQKMHERNIEVRILGYFPGKDLPDQYTAIRYMTCFKKTELNFFCYPESLETTNFISNRFDILIDINFQKLFPLQYISSLSNAGFKVGLFDPEKKDTTFDLMMELGNPVDLEYYLDQTVHYLEMIKSGAAKTHV